MSDFGNGFMAYVTIAEEFEGCKAGELGEAF